MLCTPIFILGQDESQRTMTDIANSQKSNCLLARQESTLHFMWNMDTVIHKRMISILQINILRILECTHSYSICNINDQAAVIDD